MFSTALANLLITLTTILIESDNHFEFLAASAVLSTHLDKNPTADIINSPNGRNTLINVNNALPKVLITDNPVLRIEKNALNVLFIASAVFPLILRCDVNSLNLLVNSVKRLAVIGGNISSQASFIGAVIAPIAEPILLRALCKLSLPPISTQRFNNSCKSSNGAANQS